VHRLLVGGPVRLELEALVTWRDTHGERQAGDPLPVDHLVGGAIVEDAFRLRGPGWKAGGDWYRGVHARCEAQRGLAADEDLWLAGRFTADLDVGDVAPVAAWAGDLAAVPRRAWTSFPRRGPGPGRWSRRPGRSNQ
jgi:hypothetical protein